MKNGFPPSVRKIRKATRTIGIKKIPKRTRPKIKSKILFAILAGRPTSEKWSPIRGNPVSSTETKPYPSSLGRVFTGMP